MTESNEGEAPAVEPTKVNHYDANALRRALDDAVHLAVGDTGKFQEDMTWSNARLGLMTAACAIALFGQFNPYPFPDNRWLLAGCVVCYFVLSGALQLMTSYMEREAIYTSKPMESGDHVVVRSHMPKYDDTYTFKAELVGADGSVKALKEHTCSAGKFVDVVGYVAQQRVHAAVVSLLDELLAKKHQ